MKLILIVAIIATIAIITNAMTFSSFKQQMDRIDRVLDSYQDEIQTNANPCSVFALTNAKTLMGKGWGQYAFGPEYYGTPELVMASYLGCHNLLNNVCAAENTVPVNHNDIVGGDILCMNGNEIVGMATNPEAFITSTPGAGVHQEPITQQLRWNSKLVVRRIQHAKP